MSGHLNDREILDRLYGLADVDEHLHACTECSTRWEEMRTRKAQIAAAPQVSDEFLMAQRRRIYARLGERPASGYRWASAMAAACLVAGLFIVNRPVSVPAPTAQTPRSLPATHEPSDAQLFADVYSLQESMEPRAAAPIHSLFQDQE
jgi:hypothetical protein